MQDTLSQTFAALADPTRRAMLAQLSRGESTVSDLARPFLGEMSLPAVTKHLKVLEKAGLITKSRDAQYRPCKLNGDGLKEVADWMQEYRMFWEESFDRLEAYLKTITATTNPAVEKSAAEKSAVDKSAVEKSGLKAAEADSTGAELARAELARAESARAESARAESTETEKTTSAETASTNKIVPQKKKDKKGKKNAGKK